MKDRAAYDLQCYLSTVSRTQARVSLPVSMLLVLLAGAVGFDYFRSPNIANSQLMLRTLLGWTVFMTVLLAWRFSMLYGRGAGKREDFAASRSWAVGTLAMAAGWGILGSVLLPGEGTVHQMVIGLFIAGISAGASATLAPFPRLFYGFIILMLVPLGVRFLLELEHRWIAVLLCSSIVLYVSSLLRVGAVIHRTLADTYLVSRKNEKLAADLAAAAGKAQESSRFKTRLLNNMSHELRTPLNSILGFVSLLGDSVEPGTRQAKYTCNIDRSGRKLQRLIDNLLEISRLDAPDVALHPAEIDVAVLVGNIVEGLEPVAFEQGVRLSYIVDDGLNFYADSDWLTAIVHNLAEDGLQAADEGQVAVSATMREDGRLQLVVDCNVGGSAVEGQGTDENDLSSAGSCKPASNGSHYAQLGMGLGLSMATRVIELLGGTLHHQPGLDGRGGRIEVFLPPLNKNVRYGS